ncbi:zinc finger protein [Verticillium dahliae]|nr:zinc finger protein [Verticillium dahliae]
MFPASMGFEQATTYADATQYVYNGQQSPGVFEEGDLQMPPSNHSTASACSSNAGSPLSHHGQIGLNPEWTQHGLGLTPGIVPSDYYSAAGTEYTSYTAPGMEDFTFEFPSTKPHGFVGELPHISRTPVQPQPNSLSSPSVSSVARDPESEAALAVDTDMPPPPTSPLSFVSPSSASFSSPVVPAWPASPRTPRVPPFFSQSSGLFTAPLECSYQPAHGHAWLRGRLPPSLSRVPLRLLLTAARRPQRQPVSLSPRGLPTALQPLQCAAGRPQAEHSLVPVWVLRGRQRTFKDLKAHMLTHQNERPEKCPIQTCDYHVKGFARKYDKNRHTLTHYKGNMVCGFCPGSGTPAEKSFNRADVFKRHLTAVHGVEQTPPNSRKKTSGANTGKKLTGYPPDATGKCSTCSQTFSNAQDFYEHLDDCVLRIVQQEDPSEANNARLLAEVENDKKVHQTLERNNLPTQTMLTTMQDNSDDEEDDMDMDEDDEDEASKDELSLSRKRKASGMISGALKSRGMTHSRGGVPGRVGKSKGRKSKQQRPKSWDLNKDLVKMKKRVLGVFDGPRRLAKDDMVLSTEHEVRIKLQDGKSYVTDLDMFTVMRAEGFHGATDAEKGAWVSDDPTPEQYQQMQALLKQEPVEA